MGVNIVFLIIFVILYVFSVRRYKTLTESLKKGQGIISVIYPISIFIYKCVNKIYRTSTKGDLKKKLRMVNILSTDKIKLIENQMICRKIAYVIVVLFVVNIFCLGFSYKEKSELIELTRNEAGEGDKEYLLNVSDDQELEEAIQIILEERNYSEEEVDKKLQELPVYFKE